MRDVMNELMKRIESMTEKQYFDVGENELRIFELGPMDEHLKKMIAYGHQLTLRTITLKAAIEKAKVGFEDSSELELESFRVASEKDLVRELAFYYAKESNIEALYEQTTGDNSKRKWDGIGFHHFSVVGIRRPAKKDMLRHILDNIERMEEE